MNKAYSQKKNKEITKMKKKLKKGFTLVELVIVIAVIAILSAVLIPTFGNVISNANDSAAMSEVSNAISQYTANQAANKQSSDLVDGYIVLFKNNQELCTSVTTGDGAVTDIKTLITSDNVSYVFSYKGGKLEQVKDPGLGTAGKIGNDSIVTNGLSEVSAEVDTDGKIKSTSWKSNKTIVLDGLVEKKGDGFVLKGKIVLVGLGA